MEIPELEGSFKKRDWLNCGFHKVKLFEIYCRYVTFYFVDFAKSPYHITLCEFFEQSFVDFVFSEITDKRRFRFPTYSVSRLFSFFMRFLSWFHVKLCEEIFPIYISKMCQHKHEYIGIERRLIHPSQCNWHANITINQMLG